MSKGINNSVIRGIKVLESLLEDDFQGKTESAISLKTGITPATVSSILRTLESIDWVVKTNSVGSKLKAWKISTKITDISKAYEIKINAQQLLPGQKLYNRVLAGFTLQNTSLGEWCRHNDISHSSAKACLHGSWGGTKGVELKERLIKISNIENLTFKQDSNHE
jgi:hypothetical protein